MDPRRGTAHMPCMCDVSPRGPRYACQAPPDACPPLQSRTLCALVPPLIHKKGCVPAIYLVSRVHPATAAWYFSVGMRDNWNSYHQMSPYYPSHTV